MIFVWYVVTNSRNHIQCLVTRRIAFLKKKKKHNRHNKLSLTPPCLESEFRAHYCFPLQIFPRGCWDLSGSKIHSYFSPIHCITTVQRIDLAFYKKGKQWAFSFFSCVGISSIGLNWSWVLPFNGKLTGGWHDCLDSFYIKVWVRVDHTLL